MRSTFDRLNFFISGKESILFLLFFFFYFFLLVLFGINRPIWYDERHFVETIRYFGKTPFFQALYSYEEMSAPLPFILFSLWGKLSGFSLISLRIFNLLIAFLSYLVIYRFFTTYLNKKVSLLLIIFTTINPYFAGASIFVFTDMISILFMFLAFYAVARDNSLLMFFGLSGSLLCRQYLAFLIPSFFIFYLIRLLKAEERKAALRNVISISLSCLPLLFLFIYWHGSCPVNETKKLYMDNAFKFHLNAAVLYLSQVVIYTIPFSIVLSKKVYNNTKILILSVLLSSIYFFAPVKASPAAIEVSRFTVGYLDRAISILKIKGLSQVVFYAGFLLSIPILLHWIKTIIEKIQQNELDIQALVILTMFTFLLVMPFSYLLWEKYFMPVLPIVLFLFFYKNIRSDKAV
jgi:4-amino-4-deoxy-L-arabinose transferase-like glycosyltransferase